jgi:5-hydroxyisourate hydrolase-like protein (transthyretin family)
MDKRQKFFLLSFLIIASSLIVFAANAQTSINETNIYVSIGNTLFRFEGPAGILNGARFENNALTFLAPPETILEISTNEERGLTASPAQFATIDCEPGNNKIKINTAKAAGPILFTVNVNEGECVSTGQSFLNNFEEFRSSPVTQRVIREIMVPISITVTTVSAGALVVNASVGSASFAFNITQFLQQLGILRFYALGLLRFRRKKPWGRVLERLSGRPLRGVLIQIYEAEFKKIKEAQITDAEGRFAAFMTPGKYFIKASKAGFETQETELITIASKDEILDLEIKLTPQTSEAALSYIKRLNFWSVIKNFLDLINPYLLFFGTLISLAAMIVIPNALNYIGFAIYIVLDILKIYFIRIYIKPFGRVMDAVNQAALPLAVVRIFESEKHLLLSTKVTDEGGRFNFLLAPGKYYVTCVKAGYAAFQSEEFLLKKSGAATLDIALNKI